MSSLIPKLLISGFFAVIYGFLSYLMLMDLPGAGRLALIFGLGTFGTLLLLLLLRDSRQARRYEKAEALLPWEPEFQVGANMRRDKTVSGVNVYLHGDEMALLDVRKKEPVMIHIPRAQLQRAELDPPVELRLTLTDGTELRLLTPYMEHLLRELRRNGWYIQEIEK